MLVSSGRKIFSSVRNNSPRRSAFDLSYSKKFDCDMGELIPVMCDEVVPGDVLSLSNEIVVRFQPLVAPILHEVNVYVHYYFVPYRLLWEDWEKFITGGANGDDASVLPRWDGSGSPGTAKYSLWDYLGLPVGVDCQGAYPLDFPRRAYNFIFDQYYMDETLNQPPDKWWEDTSYDSIQWRSWSKDYFTSALPFQQRGTAPALPISGYSNAAFDSADFDASSALAQVQWGLDSGSNGAFSNQGAPATAAKLAQALSTNEVDFSDAATFDVSDLRLAFQIQRWLELNARAGVRYTEFIRAHFGVSPRDDRLDRPEYIGGTKSPVIVSEVLQTSKTESGAPQGRLAGHALVADRNFAGKYRVLEYGLVMGIMSVMPKPTYQQGINRQWLRRTKYDFFFPEFANLSEQAIENAELFATGVSATNTGIFGYQGRYDEMRTKNDMVVGGMRDTFDYWHLSRQFSSLPVLNNVFVSCVPANDDLKRIFAVPSEKGLMVNLYNGIKALRPMPYIAEPGLIDHV